MNPEKQTIELRRRTKLPTECAQKPGFLGTAAWGGQITRRGKPSVATVLYSRWALALFSVQFLFVSIEAASQACLLRGAEVAVRNPKYAAVWFLAYISGWLIGQLTYIAFEFFRVKWEDDTYQRFVHTVSVANRGRIDVWTDDTHRSLLAAMCGSQGRQTFRRLINNVSTISGLTLGLVMQCIYLSVTLSLWFAPIIAASIAAISLYFNNIQGKYVEHADQEQLSESTLDALSSRLPENIMLPNEMNYLHFEAELASKLSAFGHARSQSILYTNCKSSLLSIIMATPIISFMLAQTLSDGPQALASITSAPKLLKVLNDLQDLLISASSTASSRIAAERLLAEVQSADLRVWESKLSTMLENSDRIRIWHEDRLYTARALMSDFSMLRQPGRWTITGDNGCGKSTLLQAIALFFGQEAYYLPSSHGLQFKSAGLSDGQTKRSHLLEIGSTSGASVLLLDEWNAPLSKEAEVYMDNIISKWSTSRTVVEVIHRAVSKS
ncbi:MAG: hypothetical protein Q9227_001438 [Pyrenula ochraceoflavens]